LAAFSLMSCATKKQILYFQDSEEINNTEIQGSFEPLIEQNDILYISVSSIDENIIKPFNKQTGLEGTFNNSNPDLKGYLVNSEGTINFPVLGILPVAAKTRREIEAMLTARLQEYVKDVVVDVRIMNFKITVLGEVRNPGVYTIDNERVTLPEAIGLAGDLTEDGYRREVTVIREEAGKRIVTKIDLTQTELFESPFYFLKQNDVVYVQPSLKGVKKSGFIPSIPALLSLVTVVLSTVIILSR
jgi:polysaccharide export outer membrane protein